MQSSAPRPKAIVAAALGSGVATISTSVTGPEISPRIDLSSLNQYPDQRSGVAELQLTASVPSKSNMLVNWPLAIEKPTPSGLDIGARKSVTQFV